MKLLFFLSRYPGWGGIETVTSQIVDELLKRDYSVDIVSYIQQEEAQIIPNQVNLYKMPSSDYVSEENTKFCNEIVRRNKYDLIIYQDSYVPSEKTVIELSSNNKIPFIIFEHNTPLLLYKIKYVDQAISFKGIIKRLFYPYFRNIYLKRERIRKRMLYDYCERYVMLSKNYIPEIKKRLGITEDPNKFRYINNPIKSQTTDFSIYKTKDILFVGRLVPEKSVDKILKIWKDVEKKYPDYTLSIVGDGPLRQELENLTDKLNLKNIIFYGYQNPIEFYKRSQLFLMTSKFEGWGMTLLEAMSYGCIPLAENNFSALPDIIDDQINGYILPSKSTKKYWVNTISNILDRPLKIIEMSKEAQNKVTQFSIEKIVDNWEILFNEIAMKK